MLASRGICRVGDGGVLLGIKEEGLACCAMEFILILWTGGKHSRRIISVLYYVRFKKERRMWKGKRKTPKER